MEEDTSVNAVATLETRFETHRDALLGFLRRRIGGELAEELAQETWMRVVRADPDMSDERAFRAFVFTVARRLLIDHHRTRSRRPVAVPLDGELPSPWGPEHQVRADQVLAVVDQELSAMKPELAEVFRWRMTRDLSFKEIAAMQSCSLNTALGRMHQATKRLAAALRRAGLADLERGGS